MEQIDRHHCFGGRQLRFRHRSSLLACDMTFSVYLPPRAEQQSVPVLYWLSGLTCTDENFVIKAGAQRYAAESGIALVAPDTSPRGAGVADGGEGEWDLGQGAGFYLNATREPWRQHYRMYDYILLELPDLVGKRLPVNTSRAAISGHSMGGHGALTLALKNPGRFRSVSALAPICAPGRCPWGVKAFSHYLANDREQWRQYDSTCLLAEMGGSSSGDRPSGEMLPVLVDQGEADEFLAEQLKTPLLIEAARDAGYPMTIRMQPGYDHSYFFIASFIGEHISFHARHLVDKT